MNPFYIEDIFNLVEMKHKPVGIVFKPLSKSFVSFPYGVTIINIINQELGVMLQNILSNKRTAGVIHANGYNNDPVIKDEIEISFHTNDIKEVEYV